MIRLLSSLAGILLFSAFLLLAVDRKIYIANGWQREKKYTFVLGWTYSIISVFIIVGLIIYV